MLQMRTPLPSSAAKNHSPPPPMPRAAPSPAAAGFFAEKYDRCRGAHGGEQQREQADAGPSIGFGALVLVPFATGVAVRRARGECRVFFPAAAARVLVHSGRLAQGGVALAVAVVVVVLLPSLELLTVDRIASR